MALTRTEFDQLYRAFAPEILGYLLRRGARDDAQDLLAETFLVAWRRRDDLPSAGQQRAWLYGTARRLLLAHQRTRTHHESAIDCAQPELAVAASLGVEQVVRGVLAELPEADRDLLTLTAWEHLTVAEAGQVLGIQPTAARVRLHRLRRRLAADPRLTALIESSSGVGEDPRVSGNGRPAGSMMESWTHEPFHRRSTPTSA